MIRADDAHQHAEVDDVDFQLHQCRAGRADAHGRPFRMDQQMAVGQFVKLAFRRFDVFVIRQLPHSGFDFRRIQRRLHRLQEIIRRILLKDFRRMDFRQSGNRHEQLVDGHFAFGKEPIVQQHFHILEIRAFVERAIEVRRLLVQLRGDAGQRMDFTQQ